MPPKLFLNVDASIRSYRPGDGEGQFNQMDANPSIEIGPSGTLKLYKSMAAYNFNPKGMMTSNMTSPLGNGAAAMQQSYQISEKDVQFIRTLGQGASALVQKAFWPAKSEFVAVKKISVLERDMRHQLMNDIKALCRMPNVPGLIRFYGAYHAADRGQIAVALEYMDGGSLADVLQKVGRIPEHILAAITRRILQGLAYMHSNHMVHRDIKPANILMSTAGEPKVSDFGISAFVDNTIAQCHTFLGTVTYMSPERINGQPYSFSADIWAIGLTLLECAIGKYPYNASGGAIELMIQLMEEDCPIPTDGTTQLSDELADFVQQCMNKDPMRRPTAEDLLRHPFIAKGATADLRTFMQCMYNANERLDEVVMIIASRYYNSISYNFRESDAIAACYASEAVLKMDNEQFRGRYTIAKHFSDLVKQLSLYHGDVLFSVKNVEHGPVQQHGDKSIVTVKTSVSIVNETPNLNGEQEVLGTFSDVLTVQLLSLERVQPGTSFLIHTHELQWQQRLAPMKKQQATKCRQQ